MQEQELLEEQQQLMQLTQLTQQLAAQQHQQQAQQAALGMAPAALPMHPATMGPGPHMGLVENAALLGAPWGTMAVNQSWGSLAATPQYEQAMASLPIAPAQCVTSVAWSGP